MPIIEVEGLTKYYGSVRALNNISFKVDKGEIIGLLGPNGAGKTTTMKILAGFLQPTEGTAVLAGNDVVDDPIGVQTHLGYLPENAPLYLDMVVQEYLQMVADLRQIPDSERSGLLSEAIYSTGLQKRLTDPIGSLSKGFRQRVCLAQAILHRPQVLILDEPTNGLDPTQIIEIRELIRRLAQNATVIISTHHLAEVEATCHRAIIIMDGEVKADARLGDLTSSTDAVVAVEKTTPKVIESLQSIDGVNSVEQEGIGNGYIQYRVRGRKDLQLCPLIYDVARSNDWRLAELRQDTRTLESVFRDLAERRGVAA